MQDNYYFELEHKFFSSFSQEFVADLLRLIAEQCKTSVIECAVYKPPFGKNLYPYVRRTKIEDKIEILTEAYTEVDSTTQKTRRGGVFYSELVSGKSILTVHKAAAPKAPVRKAVYRETLARHSQIGLFEAQKPVPSDAMLYGQFKYGVARRIPQALAFAVVDFPDETGEVVRSLNLLAMPIFTGISKEFFDIQRTDDIERIDDNLFLDLRSDARNKDRKEGTAGSGGDDDSSLGFTLKEIKKDDPEENE